MEKEYTATKELDRRWSFVRVMVVYLLVCGIGITIMILSINMLMKEHDKNG